MSEENSPNQISQQTLSDSLAYNSNANIIRMRLDTEPILKQFYLDVRGLDEVAMLDKETGETVFKLIPNGSQLINEKGARALCSRLRLIVNQHNSQGNVDKGEFYMLMSYHIKEIAFEILLNEDSWEISSNASSSICNMMWSCYHLFTTRAIDNLERPSLQNLSQSTTNAQSVQPKKNGILSSIMGGN
jgi:hypothetical protein